MSDDPPTADGWSRLLTEMDAIASSIEDEGWETLAVPAGDSTAVSAEGGYTDTHGFTYVIPSDDAETFTDWFEPDTFERTEVYRAAGGASLFVLTVLRDAASERAVLIAGVLELAGVTDIESAAREAGEMYTHLFSVDGTHLGSVRHDDPEPFFPE